MSDYVKPYRELKPIEQEEIYNRFNRGDLVMVNYPSHEYHKRIARVRTDGVDSDGDLRVRNLIKKDDSETERDWFYVHYTRAVILKRKI
jgi:MoxR-like ATPase